MNILHVIGLGAKKFGGLEKYELLLARKLQERNHRLIIVLESYPDTIEFVDKLADTTATMIVLPFKKSKILFLWGMYKILYTYRPAVVHTHFSRSTYYTKLLTLLFKNSSRYQTEHCEITGASLKSVIGIYLSYYINHRILCVSNAVRKDYERIVGRSHKINTMYLGVDKFHYDRNISRMKYGLPQDVTIIACVAYHDRVKGVDVLLEAVSILVKNYKREKFLVCAIGGSGNQSNNTKILKELAEKLKISQYLVWMGIQNNVPEILAASNIYCQPSRSEGLPLSIMEASLARLPVVATNVGGIPEIVINEHNGFLVKKENPEELARKLNVLIQDVDLQETYGENGYVIASNNFMLDRQVTNLIDDYYHTAQL